MSTNKIIHTIFLPAGKYYVGDLCYVLSDSQWEEICSKDENLDGGKSVLNDGTEVVVFNTEYGDGTYSDGYNRSYDVDSGTIGCVLAEKIDHFKMPSSGCHIIDFDTDFFAQSFEGGELRFGNVIIETGSSEESNHLDDQDDYEHGDYWDSFL